MTLYLFREKGITNIGTETNERILSLVSSLMNPVPELRPSARQLLQVIRTFFSIMISLASLTLKRIS